MQMKADGEFVLRRVELGAAVGGEEYVLAVEPGAVGSQRQHALMHDAEAIGIAVMGRAQHNGVVAIFAASPATLPGPPSIGEPPSTRRNVATSTKRAEEVSLNVTVECAAVARASCRQSSRPTDGMPQFTTMRLCFGDENSNDRQPAWASRLMSMRRRAAGIGDEHGAAGFEALISGIRRIGERRAARLVIGKQRRDADRPASRPCR